MPTTRITCPAPSCVCERFPGPYAREGRKLVGYYGHWENPLNPELHDYEGGFAVKWLIADQITGKAKLNYNPSKGPVLAPWC